MSRDAPRAGSAARNSLLVFFPDARATVDDGDPCLAHAVLHARAGLDPDGLAGGRYLTALWIRLRKTTLVSERSQ